MRKSAGAAWMAALVGLTLGSSAGLAQTANTSADGVWKEVADIAAAATEAPKIRLPRAYRLFEMDDFTMGANLREAGQKTLVRAAALVMSLPMPDGTFARVAVEEAPLLSPELQAQHPDIRTYAGRGIDDPAMLVQLDRTPLGFHAQLMTERGIVYVDPADAPANLYLSYWKADAIGEPFRCLNVDTADPLHTVKPVKGGSSTVHVNPTGAQRRTYRLAMSASGEYTGFFGGAAAAQAAITTTINRVRGIYENEVNISFTLGRFNIFTDPATDPFTNGATIDATLLNQNQASLDANNMAGTYDIGHLVTQGGCGGLADTGQVCVNGRKGRAATCRANPAGDAFDVDYVAHEMGHQLGGRHTFNGVTSQCSGTNRVPASAYEPGSGSTIMAYAGICGVDNVQNNSDANFHVHSLDQLTDFRDGATGGSCGAVTGGTTPPNVNAGPDFTIPRNTPFTLTATDSGATTAWEQFNLGAASSTPNANDTQAPLFRSRPPTAGRARTFPRFSTVLGTTTDFFEVLPVVDRTLNFRATARNNQGATRWDDMQVNVVGDRFRLTYPTNALLRQCGIPQDVTWDVGGGSVATDVRVKFSSDNGGTFSDVLASTPNDGMETVNLPKTLVSNQARVMLEAIGNIFFGVSFPFSITDSLNPTVTAPAGFTTECTMKSPQGASPSLGNATATDACDTSVTITNNAPAVFPLGATSVTWRGTDDSSNSDTDLQSVTVVDTTPPSLTAPSDIVKECTSSLGTPVTLGAATTNDICWSSVAVSNNGPALFPLGMTMVNWTATDGSNNSTIVPQKVTIQDTTPPTLTVSVTPSVLWPPDHRLIRIRANISVSDICDPNPTVRLISITSNEPDEGLGDGDTSSDIQGAAFGTDDRQFFLRAERSGLGNNRIYTIKYEARDQSGNTTIVQVTVTVPHDQ